MMKSIKQLMDMHERTVLITGALGGLGQVFAETISELGGDLLLVDYPRSDYSVLTKKLSKYDNQIFCIDCDLESEEDSDDEVDDVNIASQVNIIDLNLSGNVKVINMDNNVDDNVDDNIIPVKINGVFSADELNYHPHYHPHYYPY